MTVDTRDGQIVELLRASDAVLTATEIATRLDLPFACHVDVPLRRLHRLGMLDRTPPHLARTVLWWIRRTDDES
jgi:hypothetical protein